MSKWQKLLSLLNVHVGLYLAEFAHEYTTIINTSVLSSEVKHKHFKIMTNQTAPLNLIEYLFIKNILQQLIRLGLTNAWEITHPKIIQRL